MISYTRVEAVVRLSNNRLYSFFDRRITKNVIEVVQPLMVLREAI